MSRPTVGGRAGSPYDGRVLAPDLQFVDVDGMHWARFLGLFLRSWAAGGGEESGASARPGSLFVFVDGGRVLRALLTGAGEIDPARIPWRGPGTDLEPIRRAHGAVRVVVLDEGALARLVEEAERRLAPGQDYVEQILHLLGAWRARVGDGIWMEPRRLSRFQVPSYDAVQRTFDQLWPDGRTLVFYLIDEEADEVYTSLILGKRKGDLSLVTTHLAVADEARIGRGWRRQCRDVLRTVSEWFGPPHIGLFASVESWRRVSGGPRGILAREIARRHVIVDPAPLWLLTLIGGSAALGIAEGAASILGRFVPHEWQARLKSLAPFAPLGLDPVELWRAWRDRGGPSS